MEQASKKNSRDTSLLWELIRFAVIGVYGEGFDRFKVRTRKAKPLPTEQV